MPSFFSSLTWMAFSWLQKRQVKVVARGSRFLGPWGFREDFFRLPCGEKISMYLLGEWVTH